MTPKFPHLLRKFKFSGLSEFTQNLRVVAGGNMGQSVLYASPRRFLRVMDPRAEGSLTEYCCTIHAHRKELTLEIVGDVELQPPALSPATSAITVYLAGDSTVCDQEKVPWCSWGQMLPLLFRRGVAVANYAHHGLSALAFIRQGRLEKILQRIKHGDYMLIQFAHNDQKARPRHTSAIAQYKVSLRTIVNRLRAANAIPILVSPVQRAIFSRQGELENSLGEYPAAMNDVAHRENVPLLDLFGRSVELLQQFGQDGSKLLTVNAPPGRWPQYPKGVASKSHHSEFGAFEIAKCVAREIAGTLPALAGHLTPVPSINLNPQLAGPTEAKISFD